MIQNSKFKIQNFSLMISLFLGVLVLVYGHVAMAGPYTDSAHGNYSPSPGYGVNRTDTAGFGYAIGNCAHCHEQHASIGGDEPTPISGSASSFCIFADNFKTNPPPPHPYNQSDDFCFYCHCYTDATTLQMTPNFTNYDYSHTFGGYSSSTPASIFAAFNQTFYHNLDDIQAFAHANFSSFFESDSNPCVACHNPHLAKRNKENPGDPGYTAISKPTAHAELWGDSTGETMDDYAPSSYQAPYRDSSGCEPDGGTCSDLTGQAQKTPDYVTFCQDCHSYNMTGYGLSHTPIDWNMDKHGKAARTGAYLKLPYDANGTVSNYVLSCLDCHEPHGSPNIFLVRPEVNKGEVTVLTGIGADNKEWVDLCGKCHDGLLHGESPQHPHPGYIPPDLEGSCSSAACHGGGGTYKPCGDCHYHGNSSIPGYTWNEPLF
jgi:hypothetical protein